MNIVAGSFRKSNVEIHKDFQFFLNSEEENTSVSDNSADSILANEQKQLNTEQLVTQL